MPKDFNNISNRGFNEDIKVIENTHIENDFTDLIFNQINKTNLSNINILQKVKEGIFLLSIRKHETNTALDLKKITDRAQYAVLPQMHDQEPFFKISLARLKNLCHGLEISPWLENATFRKQCLACHVNFFFHYGLAEDLLFNGLKKNNFAIRETLSNRTIMVTNGVFNYPVNATKFASLAIWHNQDIESVNDQELTNLHDKFVLLDDLLLALKKSFKSVDWVLENGQLRYSQGGLSRYFDYVSLLDDILHAEQQHQMESYLAHFHLSDLDSSSSFPTVSVRSLVYLKARPKALSNMQNGYAIVAAKESFGKQSPVDRKGDSYALPFSLWLHRAHRHLFRHQYKARVIFNSESVENAFSLVGEQVSTIALFPALIKGIFEHLNLLAPQSVRLIAHNEDVLTIAHDTASWVDINAVNQKATSLFKLIANDGSDPLSLFEQVLLPEIGVGNFQLKKVPSTFFELIDSALTKKHSMPPGHDHYLLGLAFECLHEWGLAALEFQKALRLDASDPDILHGLGCALMEIGQLKESLPFLKRAFELMPEDPEVANNWGRSSLECGRVDDALLAFERAVKLSPGSAGYLKNLGDGYLLAARPVDALNILNKAVRCDPHYAEAHASLAHLHLASGDESLAKKHALLAYKENPVDANIANLLWHLTLGKK